MKRCTKCGEPKPLSEFRRDRTRPQGIHPWCNTCNRATIERCRLKQKFGITPEFVAQQLRFQHGRCAICNIDIDGKGKRHIDHCHSSGLYRGLLCGNCNRAIGLLREDPSILLSAIDYIERSKQRDTISKPENP